MSTDGPLRVATAGSVDDGKSTLIGRLLLDSKALMTDQLAHVDQASRRRGYARTDLALVTDGLRAEREQGITIDVAWRYFATPRRRFVLADSPGHVQYTRNMVTACSSADAAVVLLDARRGMAEQTRRHLLVARLLGVRSVVIAVNKMDAVGWSFEAFARARDEAASYLGALPGEALRPAHTTFVPLSALTGDNVVEPTRTMPWYDGPSLLRCLEALPSDDGSQTGAARFFVQWVIRPQTDAYPDYRAYAGRLASGTLRVGQTVWVLPAGRTSRVATLETARGVTDEIGSGESAAVQLAEALDIGRGDLLATSALPRVTREIDAIVAWMRTARGRAGDTYWLRQGTREVRAEIARIDAVYDVRDPSARSLETATLEENAIARIRLRTAEPVCVDAYRELRGTGAMLLVDPASGETAAGVMSL